MSSLAGTSLEARLLSRLSSTEIELLKRATTPKLTEFIPHNPSPKQAAYLLLDVREALYGGAAGGGKSDALLMGALQYVDTPGYSAILFRRTFTDLSLPGALMDRATEWLSPFSPGKVKWDEREKTWKFKSGATVTFGYLEHDSDKYRYQSAEFQFIGFDELTQFEENLYRYMFSRLRRLRGAKVPIRMRAASNPGGIGHNWVKRRFIDVAGREKRIFIPAKLEDNPYLDQEEYDESLKELDIVTRRRLREGDWDVMPDGNLFKRAWFQNQIVDVVPTYLRKVRYWDLAATEAKQGRDPDWTVGLLLGEALGIYYVLDIVRIQATPLEVEATIRRAAEKDGKSTWIYLEQEPGASGKTVIDHYMRTVLPGFAVSGIRSTGSKVTRAAPVSSAAEYGRIFLLNRPWINELIDELVIFPVPGAHDDQVDALSGAIAVLANAPNILAVPYGVGDMDENYWARMR